MKIEKLKIRNKKRRKLALIISIGVLFSPMISTVPLAHASSTIEITQWYVHGTCRTYEEMIMVITIYNNDTIDHTYDLSLSTTVEGIFKGWFGYILSVEGIIRPFHYVSVPIVLSPTDVPHDGRVKFELHLISENPNPPPYYAVVDEETKWVTIEKGELETSVDSLQQYCDSQNSSINFIEAKISSLNSTSMGLNASYSDIENEYVSLEAKYNSLENELANTKNLVYLTLVISMVFVATTVYLALVRKPKQI